jgi:hypothetical protein
MVAAGLGAADTAARSFQGVRSVAAGLPPAARSSLHAAADDAFVAGVRAGFLVAALVASAVACWSLVSARGASPASGTIGRPGARPGASPGTADMGG